MHIGLGDTSMVLEKFQSRNDACNLVICRGWLKETTFFIAQPRGSLFVFIWF